MTTVIGAPGSDESKAQMPERFVAGYFDLVANPNITPAIINTLATGDRDRRGPACCLISDSRTGRSQLLIGLGTAAAEKGFRVERTLAI